MLDADSFGPRGDAGPERRSDRSGGAALVIGELNVDLIAAGLIEQPQLGREIEAEGFDVVLGSASAIFASGLHRLGHRVAFVSRVGDDQFGRFCVEQLKGLGVDTSRVRVAKASATGVTVCLSTARDRALVTFPGAIAELSSADIPKGVFKGFGHLHLSCFALQKRLRPAFGKLLKAAKRQGLSTSFDPNSSLVGALRQQALAILPHVDVLLLNEQEAVELGRTRDPRAAARALSKHAGCAVVKLGRKGALVARGKNIVSVAGHKVRAIDTTGAGDSFAAGFVSAFLAGGSDLDCLASGNACGALSTRAIGGTAAQPSARELRRFLGNSGVRLEGVK